MSKATILRVATCNILWDDPSDRNDRLQVTRRRSIVDTFLKLQDKIGGKFDAINFPEVAAPPSNTAKYLARWLDYTQYGHAVHPSNTDGILMVVGPNATQPTTIMHEEGSLSRASIISSIGATGILGMHPVHYVTRFRTRNRQMGHALDNVRNYRSAIAMGDFNAMPTHESRQLLEDEGYLSVLGELGLGSEPTFPTKPYVDRSLTRLQKLILVNPFIRGLPLDGIYVRNGRVLNGGLDEADTDHKIVYAELEVA